MGGDPPLGLGVRTSILMLKLGRTEERKGKLESN
jgi:hypothetical protein